MTKNRRWFTVTIISAALALFASAALAGPPERARARNDVRAAHEWLEQLSTLQIDDEDHACKSFAATIAYLTMDFPTCPDCLAEFEAQACREDTLVSWVSRWQVSIASKAPIPLLEMMESTHRCVRCEAVAIWWHQKTGSLTPAPPSPDDRRALERAWKSDAGHGERFDEVARSGELARLRIRTGAGSHGDFAYYRLSPDGRWQALCRCGTWVA